MNEEVSHRTVSLCISAGRISAGVLKAAMRKYLADQEKKNNLKVQKKNVAQNEKIKIRTREKELKKIEAKKPKGKQTIKQLVNQGAEITNIPITNDNIKSFDKVARKYGIDYSLKQDVSEKDPKYLVFFKARDVDVMTAAFKEYAGLSLTKNKNKPSIKKKLTKAVQRKAKHRERIKQKQKSRGQER